MSAIPLKNSASPAILFRRRFTKFALLAALMIPVLAHSLHADEPQAIPVPDAFREQAETMIASALAKELAKLELTSPIQKQTVQAGFFQVTGQARSKTRFVDPKKNLKVKVTKLNRIGVSKLIATVEWSCPTRSEIEYAAAPLQGKVGATATAVTSMTADVAVTAKDGKLNCVPTISEIKPSIRDLKVDGAPAPLNQLAQQAANAGITANKVGIKKMADTAVTNAVASDAFQVKVTDLLGQ